MVGSLERTSIRGDSEAALLEEAGARLGAAGTRPLTDSRRTGDAGCDFARRRGGTDDADDGDMESGSRCAADADSSKPPRLGASSPGLYVTQSSQRPAKTVTRTAATMRCSGHR